MAASKSVLFKIASWGEEALGASRKQLSDLLALVLIIESLFFVTDRMLYSN